VLEVGLVGLAMLRTLGADAPEVRGAGEESLVHFERQGAHRLVEQLRDALAAHAEPPGTRSTTETVAGVTT